MRQGGQMGPEGNPCMHVRLAWSRSAWGMANLFRRVPEVPEVAETMVRDGGGAPTMAITCPKEQ